jgi:hypothetical protein
MALPALGYSRHQNVGGEFAQFGFHVAGGAGHCLMGWMAEGSLGEPGGGDLRGRDLCVGENRGTGQIGAALEIVAEFAASFAKLFFGCGGLFRGAQLCELRCEEGVDRGGLLVVWCWLGDAGVDP